MSISLLMENANCKKTAWQRRRRGVVKKTSREGVDLSREASQVVLAMRVLILYELALGTVTWLNFQPHLPSSQWLSSIASKSPKKWDDERTLMFGSEAHG